MAWAPSVVWNDAEGQYYVFWASRQYETSDPDHTGVANLDRIRYATTTDFVTFSPPEDYHALLDTPLIDQEFQNLGDANSWVRFLKNETVNQVYQEITSDGLFGTWNRVPGYVRPESPVEGAASFASIEAPGTYHLLLDNYSEYVAYTATDIGSGVWDPAGFSNFPRGLKHGSVTPLTQAEYDAIAARYPA